MTAFPCAACRRTAAIFIRAAPRAGYAAPHNKNIDVREANPKTEIAMTKLVLTAFAAAAIAMPALCETPLDFTWEGHRIVGTVDQVKGVQVIRGRDLSTGGNFELHVKNGFVRGLPFSRMRIAPRCSTTNSRFFGSPGAT